MAKSEKWVDFGALLGRTCLFAIVVPQLMPVHLLAATFVRKGAAPIHGKLVKKEVDNYTIRVVSEANEVRDELIPIRDVQQTIENVSQERLEMLSPERPQEYREYAEELAAKRLDLEARETAIRLYLIAGWLDRDKLGRSSLLGILNLARSAKEERKFRAAAALLDPRISLTERVEPTATSDATAAPDLARAMKLLRNNRAPQAKTILEKPDVEKLLSSYRRIFPKAELNLALASKELSPRHLQQTLLLELAVESLASPAPVSSDTSRVPLSWTREIQADPAAIEALDWQVLTEFDPRESVFHDGKWQKPSGE